MKSFTNYVFLLSAIAVLSLSGCEDNMQASEVSQTQPEVAPAPVSQASNANRGSAVAQVANTDTEITSQVIAAFNRQPAFKGLKIGVDTSSGIVTLTGIADSPENIVFASQVAHTVDGVKYVDNRLNVKSPG